MWESYFTLFQRVFQVLLPYEGPALWQCFPATSLHPCKAFPFLVPQQDYTPQHPRSVMTVKYRRKLRLKEKMKQPLLLWEVTKCPGRLVSGIHLKYSYRWKPLGEWLGSQRSTELIISKEYSQVHNDVINLFCEIKIGKNMPCGFRVLYAVKS